METFLEILKFTIPGLIVFLTAYFLLKLYLDNQQLLLAQQQRTESLKTSLPMRLQAYERLTLLCDRVGIPNLLLRIRMPGMHVNELRAALLLSIRQEFEHNTSQQLFVSNTLWKIITIARDETMASIARAAEGLDPDAPDEEMVARLLAEADASADPSPLEKAILAIRTEAGRLF